MGFESGLLALWDLRTKTTEARFVSTEPLRSASWLSDGKQLVSAHTDGSLCTWNTRAGPRPAPVLVSYPHGTSLHIKSFSLKEKKKEIQELLINYVCVCFRL